jgi:TfoX/Sxy family transcriptional regulator of competence genes
VGTTEDEIRDRAADALAEMTGLDVRRMFSGWGFYCRGLLFAAAWDGEFRFRSRQDGRWIYESVDPELLRTPDLLVSSARDVLAKLELEPLARAHKRRAF